MVVESHDLGYAVAPSGHLSFPAYRGSTTLKYAEPDSLPTTSPTPGRS
jgi:hypothetical protein